ncbi:MAG: RNA polymerase sigma factor [Planctomycetales bacterium]|nr:RNA polymerase sigma factor [Planctomycetales bacterium]
MESQQPQRSAVEHPTLSSQLLAGVQQMDPQGWSRLVQTFGPIVYRWCRASGVREADAADVVQEVFASVARGINGFRREKAEGSFRSWLATITRNRVRDYFRKAVQREAAVGGSEALQQLQQHADSLDSTICPESVRSLVTRRVLENVRAEFEATTWQAFWLTAVEGRTAAEAAQTTGISLASVYQSKSRVLRRLRQRLAELPD